MKKMITKFSKKVFVLAAMCGFMIIFFSCGKNPPKENTNENATIAKKPEWLKGPIIYAGNNQEPLLFQIRKGGVSTKVEENYLQSHSAQNVKEIKEFGGTFFESHVFKAFGLKAEKPDIELAKKFSHLLHENGIKMGTYVGSSIGYETFLVEMPEAKEWLVPDYLGQPVIYGNEYFRRRPYFAHP